MELEVFESAAELQAWAKANTVAVGNIAQIVEVDGLWYLFYY